MTTSRRTTYRLRLIAMLAAMVVVMTAGVLSLPTEENKTTIVFTELGRAGAPAAYGHLTFSVRRHDLVNRFVKRAEDILHHFLTAINHTVACPSDRRHVAHVECHDLHNLPVNSTIDLMYASELRGLELGVRRVTQEMADMVFGRTVARQRKSVALAALAVFDVISFGLTIKNSLDIATFKSKLANVEERIDALVHLDDDILQTQVRDHRVIERLLNSTLR